MPHVRDSRPRLRPLSDTADGSGRPGMSRTVTRAPAGDLTPRLDALGEALDLADGRLPSESIADGREVLRRAGERLGLAPHVTVAALAGATGSGKSSLFNALARADLSKVGVRRPTTGRTHACVWGDEVPDRLLDWFGVALRHRPAGSDPDLDGLVLLDLPDHDSIELDHRLEVDRLVRVADLLVWVLDPQKYADAAVHHRYLRPLATHAGVVLVVLNQVDRLESSARRSCIGDLRRLLDQDGLEGVPVLPTSARTGEGLAELGDALAGRVALRRTAAARLTADVERVAADLSQACGSPTTAARVDRADRERLVDALAEAAGADVAADAVAASHVHRAKLATGWPFTRWLRRLRPDPLARLHLLGPADGVARTSLPGPSPVARARADSALRSLATGAAEDLPEPWPVLVRRAAFRHEGELPDLLDRAVGGAGLAEDRRPRWWGAVRALQSLLAAVALAGALWLLALVGLEWLRLPDPPTPTVREIPMPTLMLLGGLLSGLLLAGVSRRVAASGARRRRRAARRALAARVSAVADERVVAPVLAELDAYGRLCAALRRARGGGE